MYLFKTKVVNGDPSRYPQGFFKEKPCGECGKIFSPGAPSHKTCSQVCADRAYTSRYLERNYNLTLVGYEEMLTEQQGLCKICGKEGFCMAAHHKLKLVVDHCHTTGAVRGLLCHNCNRALGLLKDDPKVLQNAIEYLEKQTNG